MNTSYRLVSYMFRIIQIIMLTYGTRGNHAKRQSAVPRFLYEETNVTVHKGGKAILRCKIEDLGPKSVVWRKVSDEYPITVGKLLFSASKNIELDVNKINETVTQWNLVIKNVNSSHAGLYECQVSAAKTYVFNVTLYVLNSTMPVTPGYADWERHPYYRREDYYGYRGDKKPSAITLTGTQYVNLYQKIILFCNATGLDRAPDAIDWFHDGHKITTARDKWKGRLSISNYVSSDDVDNKARSRSQKYHSAPGRSLISRLEISRSLEGDAGNYICRSSPRVETTFLKVHVLNDNKTVSERDNNKIVSERDTPNGSLQTSDLGDHSAASKSLCNIHLLIVVMIAVSLR